MSGKRWEDPFPIETTHLDANERLVLLLRVIVAQVGGHLVLDKAAVAGLPDEASLEVVEHDDRIELCLSFPETVGTRAPEERATVRAGFDDVDPFVEDFVTGLLRMLRKEAIYMSLIKALAAGFGGHLELSEAAVAAAPALHELEIARRDGRVHVHLRDPVTGRIWPLGFARSDEPVH